MSFLTKTARPASSTATPPLLLQMLQSRTSPAAPRAFSSSVLLHKSPTEAAKDGLKTVDRAVSNKIVEGIDAGVSASQKVKKEAKKVAGSGEDKAEEIKDKAKSAAESAKDKTKESL